MTENLSTLQDEREIRALSARFAEAATLRDYASFVDTWAENGVWTISPPIDRTFVGRPAIADAIPRMLTLWQWFVQMPLSGTIEIAGDWAHGRWLITERARPANGEGGHYNHGLYEDTYVRERGRWAFSSRTYHYLYLDDSPPSGRGFQLDVARLTPRLRTSASGADVDRWLAAWNSRDVNAILELFEDDAVMYQPQNPHPLSKADVGPFFSMLFAAFPDIRFELSDAPTIDGLHVASWERVTGTMTGEFVEPGSGRRLAPTGHSFDIPGAMHLVYRPNGRLASVRIYWDRQLFAQQLRLGGTGAAR